MGDKEALNGDREMSKADGKALKGDGEALKDDGRHEGQWRGATNGKITMVRH